MLGSLFFGEVMKLPPCTLCWYQRICLFPLVVILATALLQRRRPEPRVLAAAVLSIPGVFFLVTGGGADRLLSGRFW